MLAERPYSIFVEQLLPDQQRAARRQTLENPRRRSRSCPPPSRARFAPRNKVRRREFIFEKISGDHFDPIAGGEISHLFACDRGARGRSNTTARSCG